MKTKKQHRSQKKNTGMTALMLQKQERALVSLRLAGMVARAGSMAALGDHSELAGLMFRAAKETIRQPLRQEICRAVVETAKDFEKIWVRLDAMIIARR